MCESNISKATLGRLPVYLRYLKEVESQQPNISAPMIAKALHYGEVQVRKDLGKVSGKGKPKVGYVTAELVEQLEECLGRRHITQAVLVGAGKLGRALLDYEGFSDYGLEIAAAFDENIEQNTVSDGGKPIYSMEELEGFCYRENITTGIITVPKSCAQAVCDRMVKNHISAIWSFAPVTLSVPSGVALQQENLALSLAHLHQRI